MMERKRVIACVAVLGVFAVGVTSVAEAQIREPEQRFFISLDGGFQGGSQQLQHEAVTPDVYGEDQITATDYAIDRSSGTLRATIGARLWKNLGFGFGYNLSSGSAGGPVTVAAPHPVFAGRPRMVSTEVSDLKHQEDLFHIKALLILPVDDRIQVQFFGGPTLMTVKQDSVIGAVTAEVGPPFTAVTLEGLEIRRLTEVGLGFNVGMDLAYMFRENYGAGLFVQYTGGTVDFDESGGPPGVKVGGIQFGGGLRLRF